MDKNKNQHGKSSTDSSSQLQIDFNASGKINDSKVDSGKVISIKAITEQQRMNLVKEIVTKTKSF